MASLKELLVDKRIVKRRRCKRCNWSKAFSNWAPPGEPKKPDTWFCMNERVLDVTPNCSLYTELPEDDEEED